MANEARLNVGLSISKSNIDYKSQPSSFRADVSLSEGPTPGEILVDQYGRDVDLSELTTPGLCVIQNRSTTYYVIVGIYDGVSFFPMLELLPGESFPLRLYRFLGTEFTGTGTGSPASSNRLHVVAVGGSARVLIDAFGK
jgi:hypothetical protein